MSINRIQKTILLIYATSILIMCIFLVPNKIERYYGNGDMIHKSYRYSTYLPIWHNYYTKDSYGAYRNAIDYPKLGIQIFAASIVAGSALIITNNKSQNG
jgi:hypothetical protein